jgi:hypothetical protein
MAVLNDRAMGIMDFISRAGADLITPPNASPVFRPTSPMQQAMGRPQVQMSQDGGQMATMMPSGDIAMASPAMPTMGAQMGAPRPSMPDMGGAGVRMTQPQLMEQAAKAKQLIDRTGGEIEKDPSFRSTVQEFFGNRENMLRLALGFNTMRLTPDQGLAAVIGDELKDIRAGGLLKARANRTLEALRQAGVPEKDLQVLSGDPELLREYAKKFFAKGLESSPADIRTFKMMTEGLTDEEIERARRVNLGLSPRAGSPLTLSLQDLFERSAAQAGGTQQGKSKEEMAAAQVKNDKTWNIWQTAISGLEESLGNTATGKIVGLLPAITSNQQIAEQAISIMAPVLKNIFRESGEGVFTDKDQQILIDMIPDRTANPETIAYAIKMINDIVAAKLNQQIRVEIAPNTSAGSTVLRFDAQGNPIK